MEKGNEFHSQFVNAALEVLKSLSFTDGCFPFVNLSILQTLTMLDSQMATGNELCNAELLNRLCTFHPSQTKEFAFTYLSFCCQLGYNSQVQEVISKTDHSALVEMIPNS